MAVEKNGTMVGRPTKEQDEQEEQRDLEAWYAAGKRGMELQDVDADYGDNLPYDRIRVENEARFYMKQSAETMLQLGRRLLLLKEHEEHGKFLHALERVGIEYRTAQRVMRATTKLGARSNTASMSHLPPTKLYELAMLDDEQLDELEAGNTVSGISLDAVDKMTTRELRAEIRKIKKQTVEQSESYERLLIDKNTKLDEMERHLDDTTRPEGWHNLASEINAATTAHWNTATEGIEGLWAVYSRLVNAQGRGMGQETDDTMMQAMPLVVLHLQWHAQIIMESAQRLRDMIQHNLPMPWHPINMTAEEITRDTKVEDLVKIPEREGNLIPDNIGDGYDEVDE